MKQDWLWQINPIRWLKNRFQFKLLGDWISHARGGAYWPKLPVSKISGLWHLVGRLQLPRLDNQLCLSCQQLPFFSIILDMDIYIMFTRRLFLIFWVTTWTFINITVSSKPDSRFPPSAMARRLLFVLSWLYLPWYVHCHHVKSALAHETWHTKSSAPCTTF